MTQPQPGSNYLWPGLLPYYSKGYPVRVLPLQTTLCFCRAVLAGKSGNSALYLPLNLRTPLWTRLRTRVWTPLSVDTTVSLSDTVCGHDSGHHSGRHHSGHHSGHDPLLREGWEGRGRTKAATAKVTACNQLRLQPATSYGYRW